MTFLDRISLGVNATGAHEPGMLARLPRGRLEGGRASSREENAPARRGGPNASQNIIGRPTRARPQSEGLLLPLINVMEDEHSHENGALRQPARLHGG